MHGLETGRKGRERQRAPLQKAAHAADVAIHRILRRSATTANSTAMNQPPETIRVSKARVSCDGSGDIPAALGHPRVFLEIDEHGYVDCGYCDRRFVLIGGVADAPDLASKPDIASGASL
ncbi:MAG: zinc-finger domain-containing protein [Sphingomonadaceae bacterium]|nr:zinc-finger domain-containing protein [Sphingomonadaceae bacterium]